MLTVLYTLQEPFILFSKERFQRSKNHTGDQNQKALSLSA